MTISVLQQQQTDVDTAGLTAVVTITPSAGSSLHLIGTCGSGNDVSSVVSVPALTWTQRDNQQDAVNGQRVISYTADGVTAALHTITITWSGSSTYRGAAVKEIGDTSGYDAAASAAHAGQVQATPTTGTDATTSGVTSALSAQPALISGFTMATAAAATSAVGTGFTADQTGSWWQFNLGANMAQSESKRVTATSALAATFTASSNDTRVTVAAVFLETGAGGGGSSILRQVQQHEGA